MSIRINFVVLAVVSSLCGHLCGADDGSSLIGPASCASTACHGGQVSSAPVWNRSLAIFLARDPHAFAGILLRNEQSRKIVTRLDQTAHESSVAFDNVLRTRCLSCHTTVSPSQCEPSGEVDEVVLGQGVSCESCHGPASQWVDDHIQTSWAGDRRYELTGFRDNESVLERNKTCVRCHVGSRSADGLVRDVNHDLIAAGHPPLRFDLLSFNQNLSAHWDTESTTEREFFASSVRLREVGHALGLAAAAQLASQRARDHLANPQSIPWPELADFDCFACHQSLSTRSFHLPVDQVERSPLHISDGLPVWNAWYSSLLLDLRNRPDWLASLSPKHSAAQKMTELGPRITLFFLEQARQSAKRSPSALTLMSTVTKDLQNKPPADWHAAAVEYLRIEAVLQDLAREDEMPAFAKRAQEQLSALRAQLLFDPETEKNASSNGRALSPARFRPDQFQASALALFGKTTNRPASSNDTILEEKSSAP